MCSNKDAVEKKLSLVYSLFGIELREAKDKSFEELGLDSLDMIEFKLEIEETFGLEIQDGVLTFKSTHEDLVQLILEYGYGQS